MGDIKEFVRRLNENESRLLKDCILYRLAAKLIFGQSRQCNGGVRKCADRVRGDSHSGNGCLEAKFT